MTSAAPAVQYGLTRWDLFLLVLFAVALYTLIDRSLDRFLDWLDERRDSSPAENGDESAGDFEGDAHSWGGGWVEGVADDPEATVGGWTPKPRDVIRDPETGELVPISEEPADAHQ